MDVKGIPKASPQDIARQRRLLGVAVVAGAGALYWALKHSEETKKPIEKAKDDTETAGDKLRDAAYEAKEAGKEAWGEARAKASEVKR